MEVPPQTKNDDATEELMPVAQALREFAPGRVSRRFGINNTYNRHWLVHGEVSEDPDQTVSIDEAYEYEPAGGFPLQIKRRAAQDNSPAPREDSDRQRSLRRYLDSSHARLHWHTQIVTDGSEGTAVDIPGSHRFAALFNDTTAFLHANRSPATVRRFTRFADADIRLRDGGSISTRFFFAR